MRGAPVKTINAAARPGFQDWVVCAPDGDRQGAKSARFGPFSRESLSRKRVMNPAKKNPRDSQTRIAGCSSHENDPPDPLLRACPTDAHGRAAGGLRGQRRAGMRLALRGGD